METVRRRVRHLVKAGIRRLGFDVSRIDPEPWHAWRLGDTGVHPGTVIDVGAADGTPALDVAFPDAYLVLVDPNPQYTADHSRRLRGREGEVHQIALGAESGTAVLDIEPDWPLRASLLHRTPQSRRDVATERLEVPVTTLAALAEDGGWPQPFVLKADTEGFELEVLRGAVPLLEHTDLIILELSVARLYEGSYSFAEAIRWLDDHGFDLQDIPEILRFHGRTMHLDAVFRRR